MTASSKEEFLHFRAPRQDGDYLCVPVASVLDQQLKRNVELLNHLPLSIAGTDFPSLRRDTRTSLLELAGAKQTPDALLFVSGHQPELFHPGVWLKNFVLDQLARQYQGVALNIVIDQDLCRTTSIRAPAWNNSEGLHTVQIHWDSTPSGAAWEMHTIADRNLWDSFPNRLEQSLRPWNLKPLAHQLWQTATQFIDEGKPAGSALAAARHQIEKQHGLQTLELTSGHLTLTNGFWKLIQHLAIHAQQFHTVYQACLADYRQAHRIRSASHPVPNLQRVDSYFEMPLWVYSQAHPRRRPVFACWQNNELEFTDLRQWSYRLSTQQSEENWIEELIQLQNKQGIHLRPRALLTTMFLRLFVGDWFIHGIGGGKYDQLNDRIIRSFFGIEPPQFSVITGTIFLPFSNPLSANPAKNEASLLLSNSSSITPPTHGPNHSDARWRWLEAKQLPRRIRYHLPPPSSAHCDQWQKAWDRKQTLLKNIPPRGEKKKWHQEISEIQRQLERFRESETENSLSQIGTAHRDWIDSRILESREYSLSLFPEDWLCQRLHYLSTLCTAPA
jgi:hypothetical protein